MAKTYADLTVANATAGNAILASDFTTLFTNSNNFRRPPFAIVELTATQSIANTTGTWLAMNSSTTLTDCTVTTGSTSSTIGSAGKLTVGTAGIYQVSYSVSWAGNVAGQRNAGISINGSGAAATPSAYLQNIIVPGSGSGTIMQAQSGLLSLAANAELQVSVWQNSGGALNACANFTAPANSYLSVAWVGQAT